MFRKSYLDDIQLLKRKTLMKKFWPHSLVVKVLGLIAYSVRKTELTLAQTQEQKEWDDV